MKKRYIISAILLVLSLVLTFVFFSLKASFCDTRAKAFGKDYARIALYYENASLLDFEGLNALRVGVDKALSESFSSDTRLWYDGFVSFGDATVDKRDVIGTFEAKKMVAGGDFFTLYDFEFLSGTPFRSDDNYSDRVVIDEETSFRLYGSVNSVGMPCVIDGREFYVAGVFKCEDSRAWELQFGTSPVVIVPDKTEDLNLWSVYEIVMPNPVDDYALKIVEELAGEGSVAVDVSSRYSLSNLFENLKAFPSRSYVTSPVAFPWFENTARGHEDTLSLLLPFVLLSFVLYLVSLVYIIVRRKK